MRRLLAPIPSDRRVRRFAQLFAGLALYGTTASMLVLAGLGLDPWDVLHQGLSRSLGLGIGTWAVIVSVAVLFCWTPLRQRPGVGTVLNAALVGTIMDILLSTFHAPHALWVRIALVAGGVAGNGIATGLYIGAGLGPGPRDGLSVGIAGRGHSMRIVRTTIEGTVLVTGFLLGGTVGFGTLAYALAIGPITHVTIPRLAIGHRPARASRIDHADCTDRSGDRANDRSGTGAAPDIDTNL
ncbi:MAG: YczE/YyaS/YitT family protein [Solirubrobacteraceae bacterium]